MSHPLPPVVSGTPDEPRLSAALASLPHGPEFRFVDEVLTLEEGRKATGCYVLKDDASFLPGHFPGRPLMPAVLMMEALAQLAGIVAQTDPDIPPLDDMRLTAIRNAKIYGAAFPGDSILLEAEVQGRMGALIQASGRATVRGQVLMEAQVVLSGIMRQAQVPS